MIRQIHTFQGSDWLIQRILAGFDGEDWRARPNGMNHALWLLGHLLMERKTLGQILGGDFELDERDKLFSPGTDPDDVEQGIDGGDVLAAWKETHERFVKHLEGLDATSLAEEIDFQPPMGPSTRLGALQFLLLHENYHVGQLGALRKMLGKPSWMPEH